MSESLVEKIWNEAKLASAKDDVFVFGVDEPDTEQVPDLLKKPKTKTVKDIWGAASKSQTQTTPADKQQLAPVKKAEQQKDLLGLPGRTVDILAKEVSTPGQLLMKLPPALGAVTGGVLAGAGTLGVGTAAGAAAGGALGSLASYGIEELAAAAARQGWETGKDTYEFMTGEKWLSQKELAELPSEEARLKSRRQQSSLNTLGMEAKDIATGIPALLGMLGRGLAESVAVSERFSPTLTEEQRKDIEKRTAGAAQVGSQVVSGMVEDVARTVGRGGLRREAPITSTLDLLTVGGLPAGVKGAQAAKGFGGKTRAFFEEGSKARKQAYKGISEISRKATEQVPVVGPAAVKGAEWLTSGYAGVTKELKPIIEGARTQLRGGLGGATAPSQQLERALKNAPEDFAEKTMRWFADLEAAQPSRAAGLETSRKIQELEALARETPEVLDAEFFKPIKDALDAGVTWKTLRTDADALSAIQTIFDETARKEVAVLSKIATQKRRQQKALADAEQRLRDAQARQQSIIAQEQQAKIAAIDDEVSRLVPEDVAQQIDEVGIAQATKEFGKETGSERWIDFASEPKEAALAARVSAKRERAFDPEVIEDAGAKIQQTQKKETETLAARLERQAQTDNPVKTAAGRESLFRTSITDNDLKDLYRAFEAEDRLQNLSAAHKSERAEILKSGGEITPDVLRRQKRERALAQPTELEKAGWKKALEEINKLSDKPATWRPTQAWRNATRMLSSDPQQALRQLSAAQDAMREAPGFGNFELKLNEFGFDEWLDSAKAADELRAERGLTKTEAQSAYVKKIENEIADIEAELRGNPLQIPEEIPTGAPISAAQKLRVRGAAQKAATGERLKQLNKRLATLRRERKTALKNLAKARGPATAAQVQQAKIIGARQKEVASINKRIKDLDKRRAAIQDRLRQKGSALYGAQGLPNIVDVIDRGIFKNVETEFLNRQGAALTLDGKPLNTIQAAIDRVGFSDNLIEAAKTGRLKFETAPGANEGLARFLNEGGALQYIAMQAENAKELAAYGRLSQPTLQTNLFSYIAALYDEDVLLQQKRIIAEDNLQRRAANIILNVQDVKKAVEDLSDLIEKTRSNLQAAQNVKPTGEGAAKVSALYSEEMARLQKQAAEADPAWREANRQLTQAIEQERSGIKVARGGASGKPATLGPVDRGIFRRAYAKYNQDLDQQIIMGRHGPDQLPQIFAETLRKQQMALGEARVMRGAYKYSLAPAEIINLEAIPKRSVRFGSVLDGTRESVPSITYRGETWAQIPTTVTQGTNQARWGELAGRWMRLQDIKKLEGSLRLRATLLRRATNAWKLGKVVGRFGGHLNQLIENMTKTSLMGGPQDVAKLPSTFTRLQKAVKDPTKSTSKSYLRARDAGVFEDDLLATGFAGINVGARKGVDFLSMLLDEIRRVDGSAKVLDPSITGKLENLKTAIKGLRKPEARLVIQDNIPEILVSLYEVPTQLIVEKGYKGVGLKKIWEAQDATFRFYAFETALKQDAKSRAARSGEKWQKIYERLLDDEDAIRNAAAESRRWGFDYSDLPKWAEFARSVPLVGTPFIAWPIKATQFYKRLGWEKPGPFKMMESASEAQTDLATERERETLQFAPPYAKRRAMLVAPDKFINTAYMSPITLYPFTETGFEKTAMMESKGPLVGLGGALLSLWEVGSNKSIFFDRKIYEDDDTDATKVRKAMSHIIAQEGPGVIGDILFKLTPALTGENEMFRGRNLTTLEALAHTFGIKVQTVDVGKSTALARRRLSNRKNKIKSWWRYTLTPEMRKMPKYRREYDRRMMAAHAEFDEAMQPYY